MATPGGTQLGSTPFNHSQSQQAEDEYDQLRNLARQEHTKMQSCFDRAHQAYSSGNGAEAHALSAAGKDHQAKAQTYNQQASEFIFRENNAIGRVSDDTIDLHGQYVEEAEGILETRIRAAVAQGQNHLHVIVGKGNHSVQHIQKIKPKVEEVCNAMGISYRTEENEGRMYLDLREANGGTGGVGAGYGGYQQYQQPQQAYGQQPQYGYQQPQQQGYYPGQQGPPQGMMQEEQQQQDPLTSCLKALCIVM